MQACHQAGGLQAQIRETSWGPISIDSSTMPSRLHKWTK